MLRSLGSDKLGNTSLPMASKKKCKDFPCHFRKLALDLQYKFHRLGVKLFKLKTPKNRKFDLYRANSQISNISCHQHYRDPLVTIPQNIPTPIPLEKIQKPTKLASMNKSRAEFSADSSRKYLETNNRFVDVGAMAQRQIQIPVDQLDLYIFINEDLNVDNSDIGMSYQASVEGDSNTTTQIYGDSSCSVINDDKVSFDYLPPNKYASNDTTDICPTCCKFTDHQQNFQTCPENLYSNSFTSSSNFSLLAPTFDSCSSASSPSISFMDNEIQDKRQSDPFDLDYPEIWLPRIEY